MPAAIPLDDRAVAARLLDTSTCPDCGTPLTTTTCPACGADLAGPTAGDLLRTSVEAAALLDRRAALRERLRVEARASRRAYPATDGAGATAPTRAGAGEHASLSGQQVLLALGATLLGIAALVFTVVAWGGLGIAGRGAVLAGVTAAVWGAAILAGRRRLRGTAESLAALTVALLLLDAYAVRAVVPWADAGSDRVYWGSLLAAGGTSALLAARRARLTAPSLAGAVAGAAAIPLLAAACPSIGPAAAVLVAGGLVLGVLGFVANRAAASLAAAVGGAVTWAGGVGAAALAVETGFPAAGLVVLGAAAAGAAVTADALERRIWSHAALVVYAVAALVLPLAAVVAADALVPDDLLPGRLLPALAAACALLLWLAVEPRAAKILPTRLLVRAGLRVAAVVTATVAATAPLAVAAYAAVDALRTPPGSVGYAVALILVAALLTLSARAAQAARAQAAGRVAEAGAVVALAAALLLLVVRLSLSADPTALVLVAVGAAGAAAAGLRTRTGHPVAAVAPAVAALGLAVIGLRWAADDAGSLTVAALLVLAASAAAWATWPPAARPGLAAGGTIAWTVAVWAGATAAGAPASWAATAGTAAATGTAAAAGLLLAPLAALVAPTAPVARHVAGHVTAVQLTAALVALPALAATSGAELPRSVALTVAGVAAAGVAVDPARRRVAWASGILLALASWSRLSGLGVGAVEAYTLPSALALLAAGGLRARREPATSSWTAYGPGLVLALGPSLLSVLRDDNPLRALLLAVAAGAVVLAGARARLAAPLVVGGSVLVADALLQVGPVAAALPRWVVLGVLGIVLLGTGATYERRLAQLRALRIRAAGLR